MARMQMVQSKLQFSLDAAGLAAGSTVSTADVTQEVNKYLNVNFNGYLGATLNGVGITVNSQTTQINLSATATMPTTFMQVLGINTITVTANSNISRQITGLEVTVIIDVSYGDDLTDFKAGLTNFIQTLFASAAGLSGNLYVSVVPFSQAVNIGTTNSSWINGSYNPGSWGTTSWGGCVMARSGSEATSDDPPGAGATLFNEYYYPSDTPASILQKRTDFSGINYTLAQATTAFNNYQQWMTLDAAQQTDNQNSVNFEEDFGLNIWQGVVNGTQRYAAPLNSTQQGPNFMCPPPIVPLTNNEQAVLNGIDSISVVQGDWLPDQGLEWGWNTISPRWQGLWGTPSLPKNYNTPGWNKALVWVEGYSIISGDEFEYGNYIDNHIYGGYGYLQNDVLGTTNTATAVNTINERALQVCQSMKQNNVYVYLLGYSANGSASGLPSFMTSCATGQNYAFWFGPGDWSAFNTALNAIADSLFNLWLSK